MSTKRTTTARRTPLPEPDPREIRPPETQLERLWRPRILAGWWGLSRQSIYNLIRSNKLHAITVAGSLRVTESSAQEYIRKCYEGGSDSPGSGDAG